MAGLMVMEGRGENEVPVVTNAVATGATATNATPVTAGVSLCCDEPEFNFHEVYAGQVITHPFVLQNRGTNTVRILNVRTTCGCTTTALATHLLAPGQSTELMASLDLKGRSGAQQKSLYVESDDPVSPRLQLKMMGEVITPIEARPEGVHFGTLAREGAAEREVLLAGRTNVTFHVKEVHLSAPEFTAQVETVEEGRTYRLKIRSAGPRLSGTTHALARVLTDHPAMTEVNIPVTVFVATDVVAAPTSLILVQGATNGVRTYYVGIYSPARKPFNIIKVESPGEALTCTIMTVSPDRHRLAIKAEGDLSGVNGKSLRVETDVETMKELQVPVRVIVGPGAVVPPAR
jgi:hypothetical protein